jgi:deuterolysin
VGEVHDLSSGGKFDIYSAGVMHFAGENSNTLVGSVPYHSNSITADINGSEASSLLKSFRKADKRTDVQSDCTGQKLSVTQAALSNCARLAAAAQQAASSNDDKVNEYFKDASESTKSTVADVFAKVAQECGSTTGGASKYYCTDVDNGCQQGVLAYTVPSQSFQAYCDPYFEDLPDLTSSCHAQDQATTNLHETTHLSEIKGTDDLGYGYDNAMKLDTQDALNNADTYALFANAIYANC